MRAQADGAGGRLDKNATFGQRRSTSSKGKGRMSDFDGVKFASDGGVEMTYIPSASAAAVEDEDVARRVALAEERVARGEGHPLAGGGQVVERGALQGRAQADPARFAPSARVGS